MSPGSAAAPLQSATCAAAGPAAAGPVLLQLPTRPVLSSCSQIKVSLCCQPKFRSCCAISGAWHDLRQATCATPIHGVSFTSPSLVLPDCCRLPEALRQRGLGHAAVAECTAIRSPLALSHLWFCSALFCCVCVSPWHLSHAWHRLRLCLLLSEGCTYRRPAPVYSGV